MNAKLCDVDDEVDLLNNKSLDSLSPTAQLVATTCITDASKFVHTLFTWMMLIIYINEFVK